MDSLRLEKSYKLVGRELSIEYAALESGLDRFVDLTKGRSSARTRCSPGASKGFANKLVTLEVRRQRRRRARLRAGDEETARWSAARLRAAMAGGPAIAGAGHGEAGIRERRGRDEVRMLGQTRRAIVIGDSPYDPENAALRQ